MSVTYRTYCKRAPKRESRKKLIGSCFTKPVGGLWGCRGDEWIEWCKKECFSLNKWKECFEWKLSRGAKILRVKSIGGFAHLIEKYYKQIAPRVGEIDYLAIAQDYDAIELTEIPINELQKGFNRKQLLKVSYNFGKFLLYRLGTHGWDVPSICVFNTDKVKILRRWEVE